MNKPTHDPRGDASGTGASRAERLGVAAAAVLGWLPIATFWVHSKQIRIHDRFFPLLSAYSGIDGQVSWTDRVALLRPDLMISLVAIPLAIFASLYLSPRSRWLRAFWIMFSVLIAVLLFANLHSWGTVGRFLTGTAIVNAATFAMEQPQMMGAYVGLRSVSKLVAILSLSLGAFLILTRLWRWNWLRRASSAMVLLTALGALSLSVSTANSSMASLPITRDFVHQSMLSLADFTASEAPATWPDNEMASRFRALTRTSTPDKSAHFGTAAGNDLIVFILETGSSRFVDLPRDLDSFPTLKRLSADSVIATSHTSVFPATAESVFSLVTSAYPARSLYSTCVVDMVPGSSLPFDGFVSALRAKGYHAGAYLPFTSVVPLDKALFGNMGLDKLYYAQQHPTPPGMGRDGQALQEMKSDIERLIDTNRRYVALYLPQIGHAPWPDRPAGRSIKDHGKHVAKAQDAWLGQIVDLLAKKGRLQKTTIVFTGDHGVRTTSEDPDFASGLIDRYSFEVPLLIHSPGSFATRQVRTPTSHVDISPTLLDLFGIDPFTSQQGTHLWDPRINERRQFFLANWYFGADGFSEGGRYFMHSDVLGLTFTSETLAFSPRQVVRDTKEAERVRARVEDLYSLQQRWIRKHLCRSRHDSSSS